ncbi:MAG: hypothetical protein WAL50_17335 [Kineosporiaceae bacterium]
MIPTLAGVHHTKLPVSDLDRSGQWLRQQAGCQVVIEFHSRGHRSGVSMTHQAGGPWLGLTLDPARAVAAAGFHGPAHSRRRDRERPGQEKEWLASRVASRDAKDGTR